MSTIDAHLATGATTVCRLWHVLRKDGTGFGFTDHDRDLVMDGQNFRAATGMTARALSQSTGMAVDNSEALGILSADGVTEADLLAGRYDLAEVRCWLVNWADVGQRRLLFRGTIGEVVQGGGAFRAELRGMTEALNQVQGRVLQPNCGATLGDARCKVDLSAHSVEIGLVAQEGGRILTVPAGSDATGWYALGHVTVLDGLAKGLAGRIKTDRVAGTVRRVELWQELGIAPASGDRLLLVAGCNRTAAACRGKFRNYANFRGFPHIPGDDWLASYPLRAGRNDGTSLRRGG